jgi:lipopolysaccharide/colanic/teichoic acid biosynthesis glycosyltransferase
MARAHGQGARDVIRRQTDLATRLLIVVTLPVFVGAIFLARPVLALTFGSRFAPSQGTLVIMLAATFISIIPVPAVNSITAVEARYVKIATFASVAGLLIGIAWWLALGPHGGVPAVAVGYLVGSVVQGVIPMAVAWRRYKLDWTPIALRLCLSVLVAGLTEMFLAHESVATSGRLVAVAVFGLGWCLLSQAEIKRLWCSFRQSNRAVPGTFAAPIPVATRSSFDALATRLLDIVGSALVLIVTLPLLVVSIIAIRIDSPGPALFRQKRAGRGGVLFDCWKLRTMFSNNDDSMHRGHLRHLIQHGSSVVAERLHGDPRITRIGRLLRLTSLDELPQLWNVLRGEMSLVGPRPPLSYEVEHYQTWHLGRLAVRPGLTGPWQVTGRGRVTFDEMCRMDLDYIAHRSLWRDLKILLRTPWALISMRGAG